MLLNGKPGDKIKFIINGKIVKTIAPVTNVREIYPVLDTLAAYYKTTAIRAIFKGYNLYTPKH